MKLRQFVGMFWVTRGDGSFAVTVVESVRARSTSDAQRRFKDKWAVEARLMLTEREASSLMQKLKKALK